MGSFLIKLLFEKQAASFQSDFDAEESARRLSLKVKRHALLSPFRSSLVGIVRVDKVSVCHAAPFSNNPLAPIFTGSFQVREGVTVLEGYFALSRGSQIFGTFWFGFALLMAILATFSVLSGAPVTFNPPLPQWQAKLILLLIAYSSLLFGFLGTILCKRLGRKDAQIIAAKIRAALTPST